MENKQSPTAQSQRRIRRGNPRLEEEIHDPYRSSVKLKGPVRCPQCDAVYRNGHWVWDSASDVAPAESPCPACRRTNDAYPAGELTLGGSFLAAHADEAIHLIRNIEAAETREHPLHRIIDIRRDDGRIVVRTTDIHLPRRVGHALEDSWGGKLTTHYDEAGYFARVRWERND